MQQNKNKKQSKKSSFFELFSFAYEIPLDNLKPGFLHALRLYVTNNFTPINTKSVSCIEFETSQVLYIPYKAKISINHEQDFVDVQINYQSRNFINISLAILLFSAFFSRFSLGLYFWFSLFFVLAFYILHRVLFANISKKIKNTICINNDLDDSLTQEQQTWISNPDLCSACGNTLSKYDQNCTECGLFIRNINNIPRYSSTEQFSIVYKYKEENEKD